MGETSASGVVLWTSRLYFDMAAGKMLLNCVVFLTIMTRTCSAAWGRDSEEDEGPSIKDFLAEFEQMKARVGPKYRPVLQPNHAVNVSLQLDLLNIESMDTANGIITVWGWLRQKWGDDYLIWDEDLFHIPSHRVKAKEIWTPDIIAFNGLEQHHDEIPAIVYPNGAINHYKPGKFRFQCEKRDNTEFVCEMNFGSWTHNGWELEIVSENTGLNLEEFIESPRWEITDSTSEIRTDEYQCCPEPYKKVAMSIIVSRKMD